MPQLPIELRTALLLREEGQFQQAEQQCRLLLARDPEYVEGLYLLGSLLLDQRKGEEALLVLQQALARAPMHGDSWLKLTEVLLALGRVREAQETIEDIIAKGLDWPAALALRERVRAAATSALDAADPKFIAAPCWTLTIADDIRVCVPCGIQSMTTYILLEQEDWFEDELPFLRQLIEPGMGVLDIGANHGLYALSLAKRLQRQGRVIACEPASAPAGLLARSIKENGFESVLSLLRVAVSDHEGEATLGIGADSELNSLSGHPSGSDATETVRITTLDALMDSSAWPPGLQVDLIKIDAEGEESRIVAGGRRFFTEQDPLVLFEWLHGSEPNAELLDAFERIGYHLYRLVPDLNALVPMMPGEFPDRLQLNLFACKPSRAERLRHAGRLITATERVPEPPVPPWRWNDTLRKFPFAERLIGGSKQAGDEWLGWNPSASDDLLWLGYERALNAFLSANDHQQSLALRWAWLQQARDLLIKLAEDGLHHLAMRVLQIRVLDACGMREAAMERNAALVEEIEKGEQPRFDWPFLPPVSSFDWCPPECGLSTWLKAALLEGIELRRSGSSRFHHDPLLLQFLANNPNHSLEMDRRLALLSIAMGHQVPEETAAAIKSADGLNAEVWSQLLGNDSPLRLCLGCREPKPGWRILNISPGDGIDEVVDIRDLSHYPDASCAEIYASHVLEHVPVDQLSETLKGWRRILRSDGRLMISVPDLDVLCRCLLDRRLDVKQRFYLMRVLFGGQVDPHDYHCAGLNFDFLSILLFEAGFNQVERVEGFGLFADCSNLAPFGEPISLNLVAYPHPVAPGATPGKLPSEAPPPFADAAGRLDAAAMASPLAELKSTLRENQVTIVDVGAASHGQDSEPYASLVNEGCARVIGFEPDQPSCDELNRLYAGHESRQFLPWFIGDGGEAVFHETSWSQTGSLFRPNAPLLERFEQLAEVTALQATHRVKTHRLAEVPEVGEIDMIKIDVQGAELSVFKGAGKALESVMVIWTEVEFVPLYEKQPLFSDIDIFLREQGFLLHSFDYIAGRRFKNFAKQHVDEHPRRSQVLWADAIYVRDFRRLDQLTKEQLQKLAVLLDQVVGAHDLCYEVLQLLDSRAATDLSGRYLNPHKRQA